MEGCARGGVEGTAAAAAVTAATATHARQGVRGSAVVRSAVGRRARRVAAGEGEVTVGRDLRLVLVLTEEREPVITSNLSKKKLHLP